MTTIDRLNELLEAERAGVETLSRLFPEAPSPEIQKLFEGVRNDEARACAGLSDSSTAVRGGSSNGWMLSSVTRSPSL